MHIEIDSERAQIVVNGTIVPFGVLEDMTTPNRYRFHSCERLDDGSVHFRRWGSRLFVDKVNDLPRHSIFLSKGLRY